MQNVYTCKMQRIGYPVNVKSARVSTYYEYLWCDTNKSYICLCNSICSVSISVCRQTTTTFYNMQPTCISGVGPPKTSKHQAPPRVFAHPLLASQDRGRHLAFLHRATYPKSSHDRSTKRFHLVKDFLANKVFRYGFGKDVHECSCSLAWSLEFEMSK